MKRIVLLALAAHLMLGCSTAPMKKIDTKATEASLNTAAEKYVKLVLAMGEHDADYVDAYYGPPEWRTEVKANKPSLADLYTRGVAMRDELRALPVPADSMLALRQEYLATQMGALVARVEILQGKKLTFDEESRVLYDAEAPHHSEAYFQGLIGELEKELPGSGSMAGRVEAFKQDFIIPREKLDAVFNAAIAGCRSRTLQHIELPSNESFAVEYVKDKSWGGYNWYQGDFRSLIQVNTDLPIFIDRAIDLACHEGYPGHHVYNVLLEKRLVRDRGWKEFTVYPLFSPQSLIAEGSANYGIEMAFPGDERVEFEKTSLFPIAGLSVSRAAKYYRVQALTAKLAYSGNEAARRYLNGEINAAQAAEWLTRYALSAPERATQRIRFFDQYRSYVINYNLGKDMVRKYVERHGGTDPQKRWEVFMELLSSPRLPSGLLR